MVERVDRRNRIYFHADDYGVSPDQAARILTCHAKGVLNSISVIPNAFQIEECRALLEKEDAENKIRRVLHLNFVEGRPLAEKKQVDMLIDSAGYFSCSFIQLLKWNYTQRGKKREKLKSQLKAEIRAQLRRVTQESDYRITAIDSHQHYHMIPIVMESLLEVLREEMVDVEEIRIPVDPLLPLLQTPAVWFKVPIINWIKWAILWFHSAKCRKLLKKNDICSPVFFGIFFTCEMKKDVVEKLLPKYKKYAKKKKEALELMFHPGNLTRHLELLDERNEQLEHFYMSENRFLEAECLIQMKNRCE